MKTLLIGGARSGKSSLAAQWAGERSRQVCCIVTGVASDAEMAARIQAHKRERPPHWRVREEPTDLAAALQDEGRSQPLLLIDCLTLWTSNCLWPATEKVPAGEQQHTSGQDTWIANVAGWRARRDAFLAALRTCSAPVILVSNEVGTGIVPEHAAARLFRDEHGWLNQQVAAVCDEVFLVTAGLPLRLKSPPGSTADPFP